MHDQREEFSDKLHRDQYPIITSIKTEGDILEVRRAIIYKRFFNTIPYPEEVIRIDRSKLGPGMKPKDIVMESYVDCNFKRESTKLYAMGLMQRRLLLNPSVCQAFNQEVNLKVFNQIFKAKSVRDFNVHCKTIEQSLGASTIKKRDREKVGELKIFELQDLI